MSYSTRPEVQAMVKEGAFNSIVGDEFHDEEERKAMVGPIIDEAIADADGEIDGYLAKRYAVPMDPAPKILNKLSKDIAVYNLFSRMGIQGGNDEEIFLTRYNAAIKFLTLVADGRVSIGADAADPAGAAAAGFSVYSNPRLFSREQMRGM